jgi:hypothetical protein
MSERQYIYKIERPYPLPTDPGLASFGPSFIWVPPKAVSFSYILVSSGK